jgi:hypothetical protein
VGNKIKAKKSEHPRIFRRNSPLDHSLSTSSLIRGIAKTFIAILNWMKLSAAGFWSTESYPTFRGASFGLQSFCGILAASCGTRHS